MLVDDRTGAVVQDLDLVEQVNRVVCDNHNDITVLDLPCTKDFARTEHGPRQPGEGRQRRVPLAGAVSTFYRQIGGTQPDPAARGRRGRTTRACRRRCATATPVRAAADCPLQNAFWNGVGMFYGQGFASADDVVGHEMTHGVISHNADLFYWGQSGAINESLADIMGEIVDHRHPSRGDSPHSWTHRRGPADRRGPRA